ncbi:hypothetical protein CYG49_01120 [Candidatus Saccharibacteria bacterium]|nr:MAG: hypothetical protein CYG49_01120 [Candidatus Saccharibacteria bacterium]
MNTSSLTTFEACVLQSRAYRNLRDFMVEQLKPYDLTMMEWVLLGLVNASMPEGMTPSEISKTIDVGLPMVTNMVDRVAQMGLVRSDKDLHDRRRRIVVATDKGSVMAGDIEAHNRVALRLWLADIDREILNGYIETMGIISEKKIN